MLSFEKAMENRILLETLQYLEGLDVGVHLRELHLTRFFTTVGLEDGSAGACMSYYAQPDDVLDQLECRLQEFCKLPLAVQNEAAMQFVIGQHVADATQRDFVVSSVMASVASALSAAVIREGGDECFESTSRQPKNWTADAESALVVGFGGFLEELVLQQPNVKNVHVIDWNYDRESYAFKERLGVWASQRPSKNISGSTCVRSAADLKNFDLVSITGSTLCNGTLEYFLANLRSDAIVVLQGQSASLHPKILFEAGVNWVATTLKPTALSQLARGGHEGERIRPLLQGGLPWIYLLPR